MKKTVSINIGGIIFHIEEDGFEKLKSYLDSVNQYFSTFEDNKEIISDIEGRIAEIFLSKLSSSRQTINLEDIDELIATMGTTQDFDATLEAEPEVAGQRSEGKTDEKQSGGEKGTKKERKTKRLYRDTKRRIVGGVASGIAHYFGIDPLWIRLLLIALFINVFFTGLSGATVLAYIILWIVIPYNNDLEEDSRIKKLFRNPDDRVLGGVSGGIAAYFAVDVAVIRLIFVLSIFLGGAGVLIYIILWIITPEAKTITEKMQMEGEPVTIRNIEESVKRNLRVKEGEESPLIKILLFPFRLIALIISSTGKILGPLLEFLVDAIRILVGVVLALDGFSVMMMLIFGLLTIWGVTGLTRFLEVGDFPIELIQNSLDMWVLGSLFIFLMVTALAIFLAGLAIILKKKIIKSYVGWSLFAIWILSIMVMSFHIPGYIAEFKSENNYVRETTFDQVEGTPMLKLSKELNYGPGLVDLQIKGHEDSTFLLRVNTESRGLSRSEAEENAKMAIYEVERDGSDFLFDPNLTFPIGAKYRIQYAEVTFYVPYGLPIKMDKELSSILENTFERSGYSEHQMEGNEWVFDEEGIKCMTCEIDKSVPSAPQTPDRPNGDERVYSFTDFDELRVASLFNVEVRSGNEYNVTVRGNDDDLDEVYLNQVGDELEVKFKDKNWKWWKENFDRDVDLIVTMPRLKYIELTGNCEGEVIGFEEDEMEVNLVGASKLLLRADVETIGVKLTGASALTLIGSGQELEAEIIGASELDAFDFIAERVFLDVVGASTAKVYATEELDIDAAGMSTVRYRGDADVSIDEAGLSTVKKE